MQLKLSLPATNDCIGRQMNSWSKAYPQTLWRIFSQ